MANTRILIVQNETAAAGSLEDCLKELGFDACSASSGRRALEEAEGRRPDLALVDLELNGDSDGVEVAQRIRSRFDIPVVYLTGDVEGSRFQRSQATDPFGYVLKPFEKRQLHLNLQTALSLHQRTRGRDRTNGELRDRLQLMDSIFDSIGDGMMVADHRGRYFKFNSSAKGLFRRYLGTDALESEMKRRPEVYGLYHLDKKTLFSSDELPLSRVLQGEPANEVEIFVRHSTTPADGMYISSTARPLRLPDGTTGGVVIFRDITELKRTESELRETVNKLEEQARLMEAIYENMRDGVFVADRDGRILLNNSRAAQILGVDGTNLSVDEWTRKYQCFLDDKSTVVPTEDLPLVRAIRGEKTDDMELFIRSAGKPNGAFVRITSRPLWDEEYCEVSAAVSIIRDITERRAADLKLKRSNSELKQQTRFMEAVLDSMNDGVVVADSKGRILLTNNRVDGIIGIPVVDSQPEEWTEKYGVFFPDGKTPFPTERLPMARALRGEHVTEDGLFLCNEGKPDGVHITISARPLWEEEADRIRVAVAVFRDVTQQKLAGLKLERTIDDLRQQTHLMETVLDSMSDGVVVADAEGNFTIFNPAAERIVGIGGLAIPFDQWSDKYGLFFLDRKTHIPPAQLPLVRAMQGEDVDDMELFVRNKERSDGVYLSVSGRPLKGDVGGHGGGVAVFQDITERKESEIRLQETMGKLRDQNELMETTFNSISDGIVVADAEGKFLYVNPAAEEIVGMGPTEVAPDDWSDTYGTYYPDRETRVETEDLPLIRAIFGGVSTDEEDLFIRNEKKPDGVFIRVSGRPLLNQIGGVRGGVIIFRDVTSQMIAEEALVRAFAQGRLEVVDTVLHNIGNAINSVTIGIETVHRQLSKDLLVRRLAAVAAGINAHQDDPIGYVRDDSQGRRVLPFVAALSEDFSRQREILLKTVDRVRNRATHIADIIRNQRLLGSPTMSRKYVNLAEAISGAVKVLQDSIAKRGIEVDVDCEMAPSEIRTQESRFHQMLVNLIKNSIEAIDGLVGTDGFIAKPRISVRAYVKEEFLNLDVTDNGIGIDHLNPKIIFAAGYTTKESGSGLGLHSIANFVIGSGGQVRPISDGFGRGTTMRIKLRLTSVCPEGGRA